MEVANHEVQICKVSQNRLTGYVSISKRLRQTEVKSIKMNKIGETSKKDKSVCWLTILFVCVCVMVFFSFFFCTSSSLFVFFFFLFLFFSQWGKKKGDNKIIGDNWLYTFLYNSSMIVSQQEAFNNTLRCTSEDTCTYFLSKIQRQVAG